MQRAIYHAMFVLISFAFVSVLAPGNALAREQNPCGNGVVEAGEQCDDGNTGNGDGCSAMCTFEEATCGNGVLEEGEQCDVGDVVNDDGCSSTCQLEFTGDSRTALKTLKDTLKSQRKGIGVGSSAQFERSLFQYAGAVYLEQRVALQNATTNPAGLGAADKSALSDVKQFPQILDALSKLQTDVLAGKVILSHDLLASYTLDDRQEFFSFLSAKAQSKYIKLYPDLFPPAGAAAAGAAARQPSGPGWSGPPPSKVASLLGVLSERSWIASEAQAIVLGVCFAVCSAVPFNLVACGTCVSAGSATLQQAWSKLLNIWQCNGCNSSHRHCNWHWRDACCCATRAFAVAGFLALGA